MLAYSPYYDTHTTCMISQLSHTHTLQPTNQAVDNKLSPNNRDVRIKRSTGSRTSPKPIIADSTKTIHQRKLSITPHPKFHCRNKTNIDHQQSIIQNHPSLIAITTSITDIDQQSRLKENCIHRSLLASIRHPQNRSIRAS